MAFVLLRYRLQRTFRFSLLWELVGTAATFTATYYFSQLVRGDNIAGLERYAGNYLGFAMVGYVLSTFLALSISQMGAWFSAAQNNGTLEAIAGTGVGLFESACYASIYPLLKNTIRIVVYLSFAALIADVALTTSAWLSLLGIVCATVIAFSSLGLFGACFVVLFRRPNPLVGPLAGASLILSGVMYPTEVLPAPLQSLAKWLPLTHALRAVREVFLGNSPLAAIIPPMLFLAVLGVITLPVSLIMFRRAVLVARRDGALGAH